MKTNLAQLFTPAAVTAVMLGAVGLASQAPVSALPFGPDTCAQGFVWREAIPSDHVCVTPDVRSRTAQENATAVDRRDPNGAYGSNTCKSGFVWREAFNSDAVCVTPDIRSQTLADNASAASRVAH
jgi:hypothetical protein